MEEQKRYAVHPYAFGWAVVDRSTPGGTVVETYSSRSTAVGVAAALNREQAR